MRLLKTAVTSLLEEAEDRALYALRISDMRPGIGYEGYENVWSDLNSSQERVGALRRIEGVDDGIVRRGNYRELFLAVPCQAGCHVFIPVTPDNCQIGVSVQRRRPIHWH
jgi:hypothetical protein